MAISPRRWPRRVVLAVGLIGVVAIGAGGIWVSNVEPLTRGSAGFAITDPAVRARVREVSAMGVSGSVQTIAVKPGMHFRYRFSIRNDGPIPITIEDVGADEDAGVTSKVVAAKPDLYTGGGPSRGFGPFEPFTLAPGAEAGIEMRVVLPSDLCIAGHGGFESWYSEHVTFAVGRITRHADVDTGTEIRLQGTRASTC